jgi:tetratricopeptide (TPR) repeat protein
MGILPTYPSAITLEVGFEQLRSGNLDQADIMACHLLQEYPNHPGVLNLSGLIAQQQGELEKAIHLLQRAVEIQPSEPIYHGNLGAVYRQNHCYDEAIIACQNALKLRPDYTHALITLGSTYFATEQYQAAQSVYRQTIDINPSEALYYAYWADSLRESGQIQAAIAAYGKALALTPDLPYAVGNLGLTLLAVGEPERALDYCRQATEYEPDSSNNWMNLGTVYRSLGDLENAMDAYGKAYDLNTTSAMLCTLIGQVWREVSDLQQAMLWFDQALDIEPDRLETRCALAESSLDMGDIQKAITHFQDITHEYPGYGHAYLGLSQALWEDGNAEEAVAIARQAANLMPEDAQIKAHLATVLASSGDVEAANQSNREALEVNPNCITALVNLAQNLRGQLPETDVQQMEQLLNIAWVRDGAKASLHFGLAHYYDGCKNYRQAATHSLQANQLHSAYKEARGWHYDPNNYAQYVDHLIEHFNPNFFKRTKGMGNSSQVPIFIVGMPRSGTTLTEQILASHPKAFGVGERTFGNQGFNSLPGVMGSPKGTSVWQIFDQVDQTHISPLADWHLARLEELVTKAGLEIGDYQHIVDKMPDNYNLLGWLVTLFPNAKIIHCRRNVRDIAVSCWMTQFKAVRWAFDLEYIAERIKQYWRIMDYWQQTLPVPMLEIDYEETVADQVSQTARLLDFVGLEWDDACLQFHKTDRLVRTASVTQVRQPIYTRSLERWRHYEAVLQPLLERLEL